jgi:hypothetical protein
MQWLLQFPVALLLELSLQPSGAVQLQCIATEHPSYLQFSWPVVCRIKESVNTAEIIASYRKLAREWHPDKNSHRREEAERVFAQIAHAYDILKNNATRKDYDYALKHPEQFVYNQYRYYYGRYYVRHVQVRTRSRLLKLDLLLCM